MDKLSVWTNIFKGRVAIDIDIPHFFFPFACLDIPTHMCTPQIEPQANLIENPVECTTVIIQLLCLEWATQLANTMLYQLYVYSCM